MTISDNVREKGDYSTLIKSSVDFRATIDVCKHIIPNEPKDIQQKIKNFEHVTGATMDLLRMIVERDLNTKSDGLSDWDIEIGFIGIMWAYLFPYRDKFLSENLSIPIYQKKCREIDENEEFQDKYPCAAFVLDHIQININHKPLDPEPVAFEDAIKTFMRYLHYFYRYFDRGMDLYINAPEEMEEVD